MIELALPATLWLILFGIGRLDAKEGAPSSGDIYRWLIAPLIFAVLLTCLRTGAFLITVYDILKGHARPGMLTGGAAVAVAILSDPVLAAFILLSITAPLIAYDIGYYTTSGRLPSLHLAARLPSIHIRQRRRARAENQARAVKRAPARREVRVKSVGVDGKGRLVVRVG